MEFNKRSAYIQAAAAIGSDYHAGYIIGITEFCCPGSYTEDELSLCFKKTGDWSAGFSDGIAGRPPEGCHGNTGNTYAQLNDAPADTQMQIRINSDVKERFVSQARTEGLSLSQWVIKTCWRRSKRLKGANHE